MIRRTPCNLTLCSTFAAALALHLTVSLFAEEPAGNPPRAIFHHCHQMATDPQKAIDWYLKNLGGTMTKVGPFAAVDSNGVNILFLKAKEGLAGSVGSSVDHVGFAYKDIAAKMKELEAAGVEIVSGIEQEGPVKFAFIKDPWGTLIEIVEDPQIEGFHHVHLATTDVQKTLEWYASAFGGEISKFAGIVPGIQYGKVWLLAKKSAEQPAGTKGRSVDHISWGFGDLDAAAVGLKANGVKFISEPISFGGGRIAFIEAPDAVRIELVGPGPAPPAKAETTKETKP